MKKHLQSLVILTFLIFASVLFSFGRSYAQESGCATLAIKSAPGAGSFEFVFEGVSPGGPFTFTLADGEFTSGTLPEGVSVTIREAPQNGYQFGGIDCDAGPGIVISEFEDGFSILCEDASDGDASCIIRNVPLVSAIPTLNEWGMITAASALGLVAAFFVIRRRKTVA